MELTKLSDNRIIIKLFVLLVLTCIIHLDTLKYLVSQWSQEDYNYGYLIPIVVFYLFWENRRELEFEKETGSWLGLAFIIASVLLFFLGELGGEYVTLYFSLGFLFVSLFILFWGWGKLKVFAFPLFFIFTMFPLPNIFHSNITMHLKLMSSKIGIQIIQLYGLTAFREGNIIDLGFTQLQVVDACSGLRYLFPLLIMGLLLAYFFKAALWKKLVLVLSAIPLTVATNSLRIAMTGILYEIWGSAVAEEFFHGFSGWLIFIFGLAVLLLETWILNGFSWAGFWGELNIAERSKLEVRNEKEVPELTKDPHGHTQTFPPADLSEEKLPAAPRHSGLSSVNASIVQNDLSDSSAQNVTPASRGVKALYSPPQFVVAVIVLAGTLALAQGIEFREKIPPAKSFATFPTLVGGWTGKRDVMGQQFIDRLDMSDYVIVDYANGSQSVNFYTAYYESQRKGESIHSPETCLPGSGWEFKNAGSVMLPLKSRDGKPMRVNRAFMEKGAYKQLSYFWFPQRDRVLTNAWELKLYNFWDALTRQRTDGALVRLITPVYQNESIDDADKRLDAFTKEIVPILNEFLPQ